ncbi:ERF family protein [Streptosporangium sp. NPDC051022]|uniref:ERF family protein n=1 Tax=Streptosporangium sp. NPDC051022 TaxID=3155752 RepID=UPI00343ADD64
MSETLNIVQALAEVKRRVGAVAKDDKNYQQGFTFRGVDTVVNAVGPHLDEVGIVHMPTLERCTYGTVEIGKNRTPMAHVSLEVTYTFYGPAQDFISCRVPGEAMDSGDKATSKAMSVAWRTALIQVLNLRTEDPDPDESSYVRSAAKTVEDYRLEVMNLNATKSDLERTYMEAGRAGLLAQATVDEAGNQVRLGDLVIRRGKEAPEGLPRNKDGSVSRSKTTDEEKAAHGLMTGPQLRAHNKLVKEATENPKEAERVNGPVLFDEWRNDPPTELAGVTEISKPGGES